MLVRFLSSLAGERNVVRCTLPAKKWEWRLRAASLWIAQQLPSAPDGTTLFVSSMTNLAELVGLRPDLARCHKVLYFHENQLSYPTRSGPDGDTLTEGTTDFGIIWAQIISAVAADVCVFNSLWNLRSFIALIERHLNVIPDRGQRPGGVRELLARKCVVAYFPVPAVSLTPLPLADALPSSPLIVLWNHRWEYDKAPEVFFGALKHLAERKASFRVVVLGERFGEAPPVFEASRAWLDAGGHVLHWGFAPDAAEYRRLVAACDVAVSTAVHEFFGVSLVEAALLGCLPLAPARLSYPELLAPLASELAATDAGSVGAQLEWMREHPPDGPCGAAAVSPDPGAAVPAMARAAPLDLSAFTAPGPTRGRLQDAVDLRRSPFLYRSEAELRRRLLDLAQKPELARTWRRRLALEQRGKPPEEKSPCADLGVGSGGGSLADRSAPGGVSVAITEAVQRSGDSGSATSALAVPTAAAGAPADADSHELLLLQSLQRVQDAALTPLYRSLLRLPPG